MKRKYFIMLTLLIASIFIFSSCSKDDEENFNMNDIIGTVYVHYLPDTGNNASYETNYFYLCFTENKVLTFYKDKETGEIKDGTIRDYTIKGKEIICTNDNQSLGTIGAGSIRFCQFIYYPTSLRIGDLMSGIENKD